MGFMNPFMRGRVCLVVSWVWGGVLGVLEYLSGGMKICKLDVTLDKWTLTNCF
jgi:hypothetical protein